MEEKFGPFPFRSITYLYVVSAYSVLLKGELLGDNFKHNRLLQQVEALYKTRIMLVLFRCWALYLC